MKWNTVLKVVGGVAAGLVGLLVVAWLAWVPSATEPGYVFVTAWGERGSAPGQFNDPTGVAVHDNEIFVSDARNARIQVFSLDGNFKRHCWYQGRWAGPTRPADELDHRGG